jgi:hypothetical protein
MCLLLFHITNLRLQGDLNLAEEKSLKVGLYSYHSTCEKKYSQDAELN